MKIVKQKEKLPIINLDDHVGDFVPRFKRHSLLLPNNIRAIICGPSGCGKSNVMISLLMDPNGLKFENIYLYSKSLYQPKYTFLTDVLTGIKGIEFFPFSENEQVIDPTEAKPNSVIIFDDIVCEKQSKIRNFFCFGRHKLIDCFYLSQSYARVPKNLIRENLNLIILFKQDELSLKHIYADHLATDMSFDNFKTLCNQCWRNKYDFIVIDKESNEGRYRRCFDEFIKYHDD